MPSLLHFSHIFAASFTTKIPKFLINLLNFTSPENTETRETCFESTCYSVSKWNNWNIKSVYFFQTKTYDIMRIIKNKILPFGKKFYAINLFGVLFAKGSCSKFTINHERIHTAQMRELLFIPFYLLYILEWLLRLIQFRNSFKAYHNISFEKEAYANENNLSYLSRRKRFAFLKYL